MNFIANKWTDLERIVKDLGFDGLWDHPDVTLHGEAIVYDFRLNLLQKRRLHPLSRIKVSIEGLKVVDQNPYLKAIGIRPNKENWYHEKKWLSEKSFPIKFSVEPKIK